MPYIIERRNAEVGTKVNLWTILELPDSQKGKATCRCDCGNVKQVKLENVLRGLSKRCRHCSTRAFITTHGASDSGGNKRGDRLYRIWKAMKWRCNPKNKQDREWYVGRGVVVCALWAGSYEAFRDWALVSGYRDHLTIDRVNEYGDYEPGNCRWATPKVQSRHHRRNRLLTAFGETKPAVAWAEDARCAVNQFVLYGRARAGWDHERAVTTPSRESAKRR